MQDRIETLEDLCHQLDPINRNRLVVMVGPPGCGKSTLAKYLHAYCGHLVVDHDSIVTGLHAGEYSAYNEAFRPIYKAVEYAAVSSVLSLTNGPGIVVDRCNETILSRTKWVGTASSLNRPCIALNLFDHTAEQLTRRRMTHARGVSEDIWRRVITARIRQFVSPTVCEGFERVWRVSPKVVDRAGRIF